jgi:hypothetical protein
MATKRFVNTTNHAFTVAGQTGAPVATPVTEVTNVVYDPRPQLIAGSGDGDAGPSSKSKVAEDPHVTITMEDIAVLSTLVPGTLGTYTWEYIQDGQLAGAAGNLIYTLANCIIGPTPRTARHRAYSEGTLTIETYWPDGQTHPLSIAVHP